MYNIYMKFCNDINFQLEEAECDVANNEMSTGNYLVSEYTYYQEEKQCMNEDNNIKTYIHCDRIANICVNG